MESYSMVIRLTEIRMHHSVRSNGHSAGFDFTFDFHNDARHRITLEEIACSSPEAVHLISNVVRLYGEVFFGWSENQ